MKNNNKEFYRSDFISLISAGERVTQKGELLLSRTNLEMDKVIPGLCRKMGLDMDLVYKKTRKILKSRNQNAWIPNLPEDSEEAEIYYFCEGDLFRSISWLEEYYFTQEEADFDEHMSILWESGFMNQIVKICMEKLSEYRHYGTVYSSVIQNRYLQDEHMIDVEIMESLNLGRSTYYSRLKEGITAFGVLLISEMQLWDKEADVINK